MKITLDDIKSDIQNYSEVISKVTSIDVEVMNDSFIRIAATGRFKDKVGESMELSSEVYKNTMLRNKMNIILKPREEDICRLCESKEDCVELIEISAPISLDDNVLGVIGLICFDKNQKEEFLLKRDEYVVLIRHIADLIKAKLYEYYQKEMFSQQNSILKRVFNKIADAVIVVDKNNKIINANSKANSILGTRSGYGTIEIKSSGDSILDKEEFSIVYNGNHFEVIGEVVEHPVDLGILHRIIIFREKKEYQSDAVISSSLENEMIVKNFIYCSPKMKQIDESVKKVASTNSTVLITGESGTGKEIVARMLHLQSSRSNKPFVAINCAAIPDSLLESELFGYVKGAFTGADPRGKMGKFEIANGGILFLDEIGDMPLYMQVKLLRVLQDKKISRVGSNNITSIDVRIISATNKNLEHLIETGEFREDLYYRLNVIPIEIPPLREREHDIEMLADYFAKKYSRVFKLNYKTISEKTMDILKIYSWPGNVRELENTIEYMVNHIGEDGIIHSDYLPKRIMQINNSLKEKDTNYKSIESIEEENIRKLLKEYGHSVEAKKKIASILNIGIATLYRKIDKFNI